MNYGPCKGQREVVVKNVCDVFRCRYAQIIGGDWADFKNHSFESTLLYPNLTFYYSVKIYTLHMIVLILNTIINDYMIFLKYDI